MSDYSCNLPKVGMSLIINNLMSIFEQYNMEENYKSIILSTSSQPNSKPHLGTYVNLCCSFILANKLKQKYENKNITIEFDSLENSLYYVDKDDELSENVRMYKYILSFLSTKYNVLYTFRSFDEFRNIDIIKRNLSYYLINKDEIDKVINPEQYSTIRAFCPKCKEKIENITDINNLSKNRLEITFECEEHGIFTLQLCDDQLNKLDFSAQLRDIFKGLMSDYLEKKDQLLIMVDGRDWSNEWDHYIHLKGKKLFLHDRVTPRIFTPLILDSYGGKLSKSLYLNPEFRYKGIECNFENIETIEQIYGKKSLNIISDEIESWLNDSTKFYRDYTVNYLHKKLKGEII